MTIPSITFIRNHLWIRIFHIVPTRYHVWLYVKVLTYKCCLVCLNFNETPSLYLILINTGQHFSNTILSGLGTNLEESVSLQPIKVKIMPGQDQNRGRSYKTEWTDCTVTELEWYKLFNMTCAWSPVSLPCLTTKVGGLHFAWCFNRSEAFVHLAVAVINHVRELNDPVQICYDHKWPGGQCLYLLLHWFTSADIKQFYKPWKEKLKGYHP